MLHNRTLGAELLSEATLSRLECLRKTETFLCQKLLTADHNLDAQVTVSSPDGIGFKRPLDLTLLYLVRELLPWCARMKVQEKFERKFYSNDLVWRRKSLTILDRIFLFNDSNFLNGRCIPRLEFLVKLLRIQMEMKPQPRKVQRHRGYRDHGSMSEFDAKARKEANSVNPIQQELQREYKLRTQDELERATEILLLEKDGFSPEQIQMNQSDKGQLSRTSYDQNRPFQDTPTETLVRGIEFVDNNHESEEPEEVPLPKLAKFLKFINQNKLDD